MRRDGTEFESSRILFPVKDLRYKVASRILFLSAPDAGSTPAASMLTKAVWTEVQTAFAFLVVLPLTMAERDRIRWQSR